MKGLLVSRYLVVMKKVLSLAAKIVEVTNPDLLDINFGCPVKKVALKGAGAGVLKDIDLMVRLNISCCKVNFTSCYCKNKIGLG